MVSVSLISLITAIMSLFGIFIAISIFKKVYQENYKKPWLYLGISTIFLGISQLLRFLGGFYGIYLGGNPEIHEVVVLVADFISMLILAYALVLERLILNYFKGKFVKMKFIPVQEGSLGGKLDIDVSNKNGYIAYKKDRDFLFGQFVEATLNGYEGFIITEMTPKNFRLKYGIQKTPIAWITQVENNINSDYLKQELDDNSDMIDPIHINNIMSYVDNFLKQSENPFILIEINEFLRLNSHQIVFEFLQYIVNKIKVFNGILIVMINKDVLETGELAKIQEFLKDLE